MKSGLTPPEHAPFRHPFGTAAKCTRTAPCQSTRCSGTVAAGQGPAVVVGQDPNLRPLGYESARSRLTPSHPYPDVPPDQPACETRPSQRLHPVPPRGLVSWSQIWSPRPPKLRPRDRPNPCPAQGATGVARPWRCPLLTICGSPAAGRSLSRSVTDRPAATAAAVWPRHSPATTTRGRRRLRATATTNATTSGFLQTHPPGEEGEVDFGKVSFSMDE